jgi:hypothetical protein
MKYLKFILLAFMVFVFAGCEEIETISGDSNLKIINDCDYSVKIYFNDAYIGRVSSDEDEIWSCPSGTHTIKATSTYSENYEATHNFISGNITVIQLETVNKYQSVLIIQSNKTGN